MSAFLMWGWLLHDHPMNLPPWRGVLLSTSDCASLHASCAHRCRYLQTVGGKKKLYVSQTRPSKTPGVLGAPTCLAQHRKKDPNFQPDCALVASRPKTLPSVPARAER